MKTTLKVSLFCVMASFLLAGCATNRSVAGTVTPEYEYATSAPVSVDIFYQSLSPYGRWISYPQYGQVWIPNVGRGFEPYSTNGHWVYTDYGWTWASNYSWGWAPFHYGRWMLDNYYGWIWVPGTEWAPAWVAWRNSSDYYGWAPLGPGVNININIGIPAARWIFVPRHYFGNPHAYRYYVPRQRNVYIFNNTTIIHNTNVYQNNRYFAGPARVEVERATNRSIRPVRVFNSERPGATQVNSRQLSIYRPTVERSSNNRTTTPTSPANNSNGNRPERVNSERRETPTSPQTTENRNENKPARVFRGQENDRTNASPNLNQPARSRPSTSSESRQAAPAQRQSNPQPAAERQQRSQRVFRQQSSPSPATRQQRQPASRSGAVRSAPRQSNVQRESRPARVSSHESRSENTSRSSRSRGR